MYLNSPGEIRDWASLKLDFYVYLFDNTVLAQGNATAVTEIRSAMS